MVSFSRAKLTFLAVLSSSGFAKHPFLFLGVVSIAVINTCTGSRPARTGSRPARAAAAAKDLITTVATCPSFSFFLGLERGLGRCCFSGVVFAFSLAVPSVPSSVLGFGGVPSLYTILLAGAALRR